MMQRVMIQADEALLERARQVANDRGVSVAQVARTALEREVGPPARQPDIKSAGVFDSGRNDLSRRAADDEYTPPPFRS